MSNLAAMLHQIDCLHMNLVTTWQWDDECSTKQVRLYIWTQTLVKTALRQLLFILSFHARPIERNKLYRWLKMQITQIKDQFTNIDILLDRSDTIWNQFACIRSKKIHIPLLTHLPDDVGVINIIYGIRILIAIIAIVVCLITSDIITYTICWLIWILLVLILLLDCNYIVFFWMVLVHLTYITK